MINSRKVCNTNSFIANDYYKGELNNTEYVRNSKPIYTKKASEATMTKRRNDAKYVSRKNICSSCFTTKSVANNTCMCDN